MANPTIQDLMNLINERHDKTENKMETTLQEIKGDVDSIRHDTEQNKNKLSELEKNIELLKQDKLKNNIKIAGLPDIKFDPKALVYSICNILDIEMLDDEFDAYHTRNGNFVIVYNSIVIKKNHNY